MRHRAEILEIESALRNAESEMRDLLGVLSGEYKPRPHEDGVIGTYKIYEVKHWVRQVRLGIRALKKELRNAQTEEG